MEASRIPEHLRRERDALAALGRELDGKLASFVGRLEALRAETNTTLHPQLAADDSTDLDDDLVDELDDELSRLHLALQLRAGYQQMFDLDADQLHAYGLSGLGIDEHRSHLSRLRDHLEAVCDEQWSLHEEFCRLAALEAELRAAGLYPR